MTVRRMSNEAAEADEEGWKKMQKNSSEMEPGEVPLQPGPVPGRGALNEETERNPYAGASGHSPRSFSTSRYMARASFTAGMPA